MWKSYPSEEDGLMGRGLEVELRGETLYFEIALKHFSRWTIVKDFKLPNEISITSLHGPSSVPKTLQDDGHHSSVKLLEHEKVEVDKGSPGDRVNEGLPPKGSTATLPGATSGVSISPSFII